MENTLNKTQQKAKGITQLSRFNIWVRIAFAIIFFILGFNLSRSAFFMELPFFGYHTVWEVLISAAAGLIGFYVFPLFLISAQYWIEATINKVVNEIVTNFWDQQSRKIQEARREKQKRKVEEEDSKRKSDWEHAVVLDTSVLVDGRVVDIVKTGFLDHRLIIIQAVLDELQTIADSKDKLKRQRGRRGLDVAKELKKHSKVVIPDIGANGKGVDAKLVSFAKEHKLKLMTMDFNLNKVAQVSGVKTLNLNDLINGLKTIMLPGEAIKIKVVQQGKEKEQGVGYLPDGTMIIVEGAKERVGDEVDAVVSKIIQSSAGRIIFSKVSEQLRN
ncbi:TPA: PIN domain nuclease [candidate division WWE3 bacterium]|uniref:TRAM domain-containing protein n=3 Tax=Katanobacteria TaxID=422282 RepID=A0A1F4W1L5_UNCKA|nr:MAG: hypothetical protein A2200_00570 [candidate division WWE3 bacterium RIFOXYA1_FULL_41_11]OGC63312.1 MAG: hypothetical protein A2399_04025 [candidate division WWE3 bacterium RIFOXYB1_FULL_42_27]OGC71356.1 MAG: hypothetical protein A2578_03160 [candidate division WWE3 bacterium RIFOXYD1_FULL_42_24]OGC74903.1 MAG: hypothetical protein A2425_00335 [candidate division WWE3 bacterium RIFOXYC1_FULL_42_17]HBI35840.1 PIN domain nuclease [candidate division WWE3 bacterium]